MRIMLISTPRSGNTWVRVTLRNAYGLSDFAVHNITDIPSDLPDNYILQMHWYREPSIQSFIAKNGFKVLVIARHPLDVLLSILHFSRYEPDTARWLEGNGELPDSLKNAKPTSQEFLDFALSFGAENLLSVSYLWWHDKEAVKVRYEDLVANPHTSFQTLATQFGQNPQNGWEKALASSSLSMFQAMPNKHGWRGQPGLWQSLIPPMTAYQIYRRHKRFFDVLGYNFKPYFLSKAKADRNWEMLA